MVALYLQPYGYLIMQQTRRDIFQGIADPTRREIIYMLTAKTMNLNAVADHFSISRQAIAKHIRILTECGLIDIREQGREKYCRTNVNKLKEVDQWIETYREFWTTKLNALDDFLKSTD